MLDAAVSGAIFASPNAGQIETGLNLIQSSHGVLIIVKNYTGDKLNFTLAAERFGLASGVPTRLVVVADDVAIGRSKAARVGRRGLAGTVLVHKIAGGASADGLGLDDAADLVEFVTRHMGTMGVGLDGCDVPGKASSVRLGPDEVQLGIGIHNEPGSRKLNPKPPPKELVGILLANILSRDDKERNYLESSPLDGNHKVVVLINNLGSLSNLEIAALVGETYTQLTADYGITPTRIYAGTYLSALNGPGFSITIMALPIAHEYTRKILRYLDSPTDAPGWASSIPTSTWSLPRESGTINSAKDDDSAACLNIPNVPCEWLLVFMDLYSIANKILGDMSLFASIIDSIHSKLIAEEPEITRLDTLMGDGDCGTTLLAGIGAISKGLQNGTVEPSSLTHGIMSIAEIVSQSMGGTSGALYAVFFTALSSSLCVQRAGDFPSIVRALDAALKALQGVTAARVGDRTMMDSLIPFVKSLVENSGCECAAALDAAVLAAKEGCKGTASIKSQFGRSTYVSTEDSGDTTGGLVDPGACGVVAIVQGVLEAVKGVNDEAI